MTEIKTYLGHKGYTIFKNRITVHEQKFIRSELTVGAYIPNAACQPEKYPIYRESAKKFYVPRHFGESVFGVPDEYHISKGDTIDVSFTGSLRDNQIPVIKCFVESTAGSGGLLELPCGFGKTTLALKIISLLKVKTLVIVHKEFLMNQWIERINEFLPNARVGKIQGQTIDIENKDIVIGMLQSLAMKEYPSDLFSSFGFTIVDECHHISSAVFVRSLFKIVTHYTLGLSATMQRKDGLTKVFKMFLGDVLYKAQRDGGDNVLVKVYRYHVDDEEFNEVKYDYRGNVQYSTMISKLCTFNSRCEFILKILEDHTKEDGSRQYMILAHNKNILTYLYKAIENRRIADGSVGYYVGGMKEADLKRSETKKVVIATYSMAAEALDIKTLTTLIMATPKTDVTQSIGRILRAKHTQPLVIDIVDSHDVFKRQFKKREAYYKKEKYKIIGTSNEMYTTTDYEIIYDPDDPKCKSRNNYKSECKSTEEQLKGQCLLNISLNS